ncbi:uncharacterized protein [Littorina saxatilis]|uniref:RRM domain-containing protein n=1 Tax=Littorina saxatilis TaxID=31220 RepID=A0AAN9BPL1_9CAEN
MDMDDPEDFSILPGFEGLEELYAIEDVCNESSMHHLQEPGYKTGNVAFMDSGSVWTEHAQSQETGQSGIQAMTMESLLDQFEDTTTVSSNGRDYIQFHNVTDDAPLHSQSLPVSRVCSAANSPAPTPPASPPPDILHKIRSNHNQATKRKAAIMLPYLAPTKPGKGKVGMLETPTAASRTSRLQKILSRNTSTPSELPEGLQPNLSAVLQPIELVGVDSVGVSSVRHNGGVVTSVVSPTATSVPADLRMSRITDPGMAQSILSKTPRALSLLAGHVSSENLAKNSQANNTAVKNSIGSKSSNAVQVLNMQNTASGFVSLLPKPAMDLNCATSSEALNQSVTVSRGTPVPPLKPSVAKKQEEPQKRCDIVLSRSAEQIPAEGLQSVLDHDYCHDSLRRVIVDEFDLLVSPTKSHCQKPLQKVKSLPILPSGQSAKTQIVSKANDVGQTVGAAGRAKSLPILPSGQSAKTQIVSKANDVGQTVGAAGRATTTQGQPLRVGAVTTSTSKITSNMGAVNSNAVINLIAPSTSAGSAATAVVHNTQEKQNVRSVPAVSNPPQPVTVSLMSVLSKVQNIESLFTLENGTLKLHPSVAASINPAAFVTPVPQNSQQVGPSVGSVTVNSSDQKNGLIQGRSTAKVVPNAPRYVQQNVPTSSMNSANTAVKNQQQATTPVVPLTAPTPRLAKVSSIPVPNSAKTDINRNTSNQPKKPLSDRANTSSVTRNATSGKEQKIPPAQAQRKKKQDQYSHSTEVVNDTPPPEVPSSCCLEQIKVAPMKGISKKPGDFDADNQQSELNDSQSDSTTNSQETSVMYSMPVFDFDEPSTTGMSDRVVTPVKIQTCAEESPTTRQSPKITPQPYSPQTCDEKPQPRQPSPRSPPVSPKDDPHACSPCATSPEAGTSHEPMQQYVDEFDLIWEEHEQEAAAQGRASLERRTVTYHDQSRPESSRGAGTNRGRGASRRGRKSGKWQPGSSPVKEDSSGFFSKIPSYYTALSIPTKTGRKQLTAEDAEGLTIHDFIPADHDPIHSTEDREWYDKMPSYFSCFTNSTKYDSAVTHGDFGKVDQTKKAVGSSFVGGSPKSPSPGHSQRKSPSPTTSQRSSRSREGDRSRKRRRSNSSSVSSGSRSRSWKTGKRRQRRSPSGSGSCRSSSGSRSRSGSSSRSGSRYSRSCSRSRSRSKSRSRSRGRRYRSGSGESRYSSGSRRSRRNLSRDRALRKQLRREDKIKKMEERKIVYVGRIPEDFTRRNLYQRFERFGKIEDVSVHFREAGDNYGFVTFFDSSDAFRAIDKGNTIPGERQFDLCFGGRRHFCANDYADLDGNRVIEEEYAPVTSKGTVDFDELLRQAQRSQRK